MDEALGTKRATNIYLKPEVPEMDMTSYQLESSGSDEMVSVLLRVDQDHMEEINELYTYIDKVKNMVIPGCSDELLKAALNSMSSLLSTISFMSTVPRLQASL